MQDQIEQQRLEPHKIAIKLRDELAKKFNIDLEEEVRVENEE